VDSESRVSFSRHGGENNTGAQIEEKNLLGTGQVLQLEWEQDVDREAISFAYRDPHFLHSFSRLAVSYQDADDGDTKQLLFDRPFYALDTRLAGGIALDDAQRNEPRYVLGHKVGEFEHTDEFYEFYGGVSSGLRNGWVTRWTAGMTYEHDRFALAPGEDPGGELPENRELAYPWLGVELGPGRLPGAQQPGPDLTDRRPCSWAFAPVRGWATHRPASAPIAMR
jgi:hypothetical protein